MIRLLRNNNNHINNERSEMREALHGHFTNSEKGLLCTGRAGPDLVKVKVYFEIYIADRKATTCI